MNKSLVNASKNNDFVLRTLATVLKENLGREVWGQTNGIVAYGAYRGMRIPESNPWSGALDTGAMIWGTYEKQVVDFLSERVPKHHTFIDVGASFGFHAIGSLIGGLASKVIAYESDLESAALLLQYARHNNVTVDVRGVLRAEALKNFFNSEKIVPANTVFLFDIEGGERDLLTAETISLLAESWLIVEIHCFIVGYDKETFVERFNATHDISLVVSRSDLPPLPHLEGWDDLSRNLIMSENRPKRMQWLLCEPRN